MRGFIAQLVEHRTGLAEVTGSNPVETLIFFFFSGFFFPIALIGKFTAMITFHFQNNTWLLVDMKFLFSCPTQHLTCELSS